MNGQPLLDVDQQFLEFFRTRDPHLRDKLIESYLPLAQQIARRFLHRGESLDDLVQAGSVALIKAVDRFDPHLGFQFPAYASKTIIGELKRHFRDKGWSVRAPRHVQELYLELGAVVDELSQKTGRSPTIRELASATGSSEDEVIEALEASHAYRSTSLDAPGPEGDTLGSRIGQEDAAYVAVEERAVVLPGLAQLPERERTILELRFVHDMTQAEIAQQMGISQMHISRLLARSITMLHRICEPAED